MEKHAGDVTLFLTSARRQRGKKKERKADPNLLNSRNTRIKIFNKIDTFIQQECIK